MKTSVLRLINVWVCMALLSTSLAFDPSQWLKTGLESIGKFGGQSVVSSIASVFSRGLHKPTQQSHSATNLVTYKDDKISFSGKTTSNKNSVIDSLFELNVGTLDDIPTQNHSVDLKAKEDEGELNSIASIFHDISFLPLIENKKENEVVISPEDKPLLEYLDSIRKDAWTHFKTIIVQYVNAFQSPNGESTVDSLPIKMLLNVLDMGDKLNIIHLLGKKVDPDVARFFLDKIKTLSPDVMGFKNITGSNIAAVIPPLNGIIHNFAWMSLKHIIDRTLSRVDKTLTRSEINNYVSELEKNNPFAAKGLKFVINLPSQIPTYTDDGEGRSFDLSRKLRISERDSGYGHHDDGYGHHDVSYGHHDDGYGHKDVGYGGYGSYDGSHGGGYHQTGIYLDPYLILAGIGTAALLAFVALRILTTTAAPAPGPRKRSVDDTEVAFVLDSIDEAYELYNGIFESEAEEFINGVNEIWRVKKRNGCIRCSLSSKLHEMIVSNGKDSFKTSILTGLGHLLGVPKAGQLLDQAQERHLKRENARKRALSNLESR